MAAAANVEKMWTSKLGNKYPFAWMQQNDQASQKQLKGLRGNSVCADCGCKDNSWASVSHGVFICMICSDVHRSVGTHITKVKGCTGTYLWGPDELEMMKSVGNRGGDEIYGAEKISPDASKEQKQRFVVDKYEKRAFAGKVAAAPAKTESPKTKFEQPSRSVVRRAEPLAPAAIVATEAPTPVRVQPSTAPAALAAEIPSSLFDDLFNEAEDSYFGSPAAPLKSSTANIVQHALLPCSAADNGLDAFLNSTLQVPAAKAASLTDPFADW